MSNNLLIKCAQSRLTRRLHYLLYMYIFYILDVLKCYMCTSLSNDSCNSSLPATNSLEPVECTIPKIAEWQRTISQHKILKLVANLFEVDDSHHHYQANTPMACAKMVLNSKYTCCKHLQGINVSGINNVKR